MWDALPCETPDNVTGTFNLKDHIMVTVTCDKCGKAMDMRSFNTSQTSITFQYKIQQYVGGSDTPSDIDVCPHCAVATLSQLVQSWGG